MNYNQRISEINTWIATIGAFGAWTFVLVYGLAASWWNRKDGRPNILGRVIMLMMFCLAALMTTIVAFRWFQDFPFRREINTVVFSLLVVSVYGFLILFLVLQRRAWKAIPERKHREPSTLDIERKDDDNATP